jgi:hypothetical protein
MAVAIYLKRRKFVETRICINDQATELKNLESCLQSSNNRPLRGLGNLRNNVPSFPYSQS